MKIAIMQPYFLPYIGYFQLLNAVDTFIVYDNIEFTKKGWINRNRFLMNGEPKIFTINLHKDSDYLHISQRKISQQFLDKERKKTLAQIQNSYKKAPYFKNSFPIIEACFNCDNDNLFAFVENSIKLLSEHLDIDTQIINSSSIDTNHNLKNKERVIDLVKCVKGTEYINPIGGIELYNKEEFAKDNIELKFIKTQNITYQQFNNEFQPYLSIIDVLMFNDIKTIKKMLQQYDTK